MNAGIVTMTAPASRMGKFVGSNACSRSRASGSVNWSGDEVEQWVNQVDQWYVKASITTANIADRPSGTATSHHVRSEDSPSTLAASNRFGDPPVRQGEQEDEERCRAVQRWRGHREQRVRQSEPPVDREPWNPQRGARNEQCENADGDQGSAASRRGRSDGKACPRATSTVTGTGKRDHNDGVPSSGPPPGRNRVTAP